MNNDERTNKQIGIFTLTYNLLDQNDLPNYEEVELRQLLNWFKANLKIPTKFSRKSNSNKTTKGISWIKESSQDCVKNLWKMKNILSNHDIIIEVIRTEKPGYIVYEDSNQIVAEPFREENILRL